MRYEVNLTSQAIEQISETASYIANVLREPATACKWVDFLQKEISTLESMPAKHPLVEEEPWHTKGIRRKTVKGFLVYYLINEGEGTVWVIAVLYGRRDQLAALSGLVD